MKRFLALLLLPLALTAPAQAAERPVVKALDRIVAIVNNDVITQQELNNRVSVIVVQLKKNSTELPPPDVLQKQVLERMIYERIQLQYAQDTGIRVDDAQLNQTLERIAQQNKMDVAAFRQTLEKDGVSFAKFREELRNEIIISRLRDREVDSKVIVSDSEVNSALSARAAATGGQEEFHLAHVLVSVPEQASPEQIQASKKRADAALAELKKGVSFKQVAATYSDAPDAMEGGDLDWRTSARLPGLFVEALQSMKPGDISAVLRSPNGFHIFKLIERRNDNAPMMVEQTHARHILIRPSELLSDTDAHNRVIQLRERIVNGGDFAQLARLNSEDGSSAKGGDLGWISPGDTVPEFEKAMSALKPGEVSQPVRTQFGWHLIQVLERRTQDVGDDRRKLAVRQQIRERKSDEQYQDWVRQLRDRTYVEYRLDDKN